MSTTNDISAKEQAGIDREKSIQSMLFRLQTMLSEVTDEVDRSYALLKIGEKTDLSKQIEEGIDNPIAPLLHNISIFDNRIKSILDGFAKWFLTNNTGIISCAYRTKTDFNDLHYSIVLKEDNIKYRNKIFGFYGVYDELSFSENIAQYNLAERYPVYFQFVPEHLIHKIKLAEQIIPEVK